MKNLFYACSMLMLMIACKSEPKTVAAREVNQYTIEQFYANTRFSGGVFSPDETKLVVNSDESGIFNLYEINIADGTKKQITSSSVESYYVVDYVPGSNQLIYSADKGGNEINHLYLINEDGTSTDLTPAEKEKSGFFKWVTDKKSMFYTSNKRDEKYFDVYKMGIADWKASMFYENKDGLDVTDISDDENMIALVKPVTSSENQLFMVNRQTGERKEISKPEQKGSYSSSGFSKDNKYLYYITDAGKEFAYLAQYDIVSGESKILFETKWDVMYSYLSETEKYRVIGINE
ncbi:MAG: DPP IV N-terminal domain-containing protein, partial [Bacteroidota bacterium]|nr:DPP IV N-terminal domain-containing protein [Bacteroidota bacterium]